MGPVGHDHGGGGRFDVQRCGFLRDHADDLEATERPRQELAPRVQGIGRFIFATIDPFMNGFKYKLNAHRYCSSTSLKRAPKRWRNSAKRTYSPFRRSRNSSTKKSATTRAFGCATRPSSWWRCSRTTSV